MNRLLLAAVVVGGLSACIIPTRRGPVLLTPPVPHAVVAPAPVYVAPAPVVVAPHIHGPGCGHEWGYYGGYPVYYHENYYSYHDGSNWVRLEEPPEVYYRNRGHHHAVPAAPSYQAPTYSAPPPPTHSATPVYSAPPPRPSGHAATPVYSTPPPPSGGHGAAPVLSTPPPPQQTPPGKPRRHDATPARP
jgi:hypothetical protein